MPDSAVDLFEPDCVILEVAERALFVAEEAFSDFPARTFSQDYLEIAGNPAGGRLQVQSINALMAGKVDEAIGLAAMAISKEGDSPHVYNLAWALRHKEQFDLCYRLASDISEAAQDRFLFYLQADCAYFLGKARVAVDTIDKALALQPRNALYLYLKGDWLLQLGDAAGAAEALQESIRYAPLHDRSWPKAIEAVLAAGDKESAARLKAQHHAIFGNPV
jgi:tetratricopeptide (TPR) repeat protein